VKTPKPSDASKYYTSEGYYTPQSYYPVSSVGYAAGYYTPSKKGGIKNISYNPSKKSVKTIGYTQNIQEKTLYPQVSVSFSSVYSQPDITHVSSYPSNNVKKIIGGYPKKTPKKYPQAKKISKNIIPKNIYQKGYNKTKYT
jgi:hypothetical protein